MIIMIIMIETMEIRTSITRTPRIPGEKQKERKRRLAHFLLAYYEYKKTGNCYNLSSRYERRQRVFLRIQVHFRNVITS